MSAYAEPRRVCQQCAQRHLVDGDCPLCDRARPQYRIPGTVALVLISAVLYALISVVGLIKRVVGA
jgi:hypothetical protein